jgi:hypothetical protein
VKIATVLLASLLLLAAAPVPSETPSSLKEAVEQGFTVVGVVGQGASGEDHVIYLQQDKRLIICGFRVVLLDQGFDGAKSGQMGQCTGLK